MANKKKTDAYVAILKSKGLNPSEFDIAMLSELLYHFTLMDDAKGVIKSEGVLTTDSNGNPKTHPAFTVYMNTLSSLLGISKKLGLTLKDAKELGVLDAGDDDGFDD